MWWTKNALEESAPWSLPDAAAWHFGQFLDQEPVAVGLRVQLDSICDRSGSPVPSERVHFFLSDMTPELSVTGSVPADAVAEVRSCPRRIGFSALAGLLHLTREELNARVRDQSIVRFQTPEPMQEPFWYYDHVAEMLPPK